MVILLDYYGITIFNGKTHYKLPFSIAMLVITNGYNTLHRLPLPSTSPLGSQTWRMTTSSDACRFRCVNGRPFFVKKKTVGLCLTP